MPETKLKIFAACLLGITAILCAQNEEPPLRKPQNLPEEFWEQLVAIDRESEKIRDLSAGFLQHKFTPILKKPLVSEGRLWVRGDRMLWQTEKPRPGILFMAGGDMHLFYPQEKRMEIYPLREAMAESLAGPLPRLKQLLEGFRIEPADAGNLLMQPVDLELTPEQVLAIALFPVREKLAERITRVDVLLDKKIGVMRRMSQTDPRGQRTVLTLNNVLLNSDFDEKLLAPEIPEGTRISRPLEALNP